MGSVGTDADYFGVDREKKNSKKKERNKNDVHRLGSAAGRLCNKYGAAKMGPLCFFFNVPVHHRPWHWRLHVPVISARPNHAPPAPPTHCPSRPQNLHFCLYQKSRAATPHHSARDDNKRRSRFFFLPPDFISVAAKEGRKSNKKKLGNLNEIETKMMQLPSFD